MGLDAEVIVIGPCGVLRSCMVLDYPDDYYDDIPVGALVLGTVAYADTTYESQELARICGVEPWDLGNHQVKKLIEPNDPESFIGSQFASVVYTKLNVLLKSDNVQVWYRPNG